MKKWLGLDPALFSVVLIMISMLGITSNINWGGNNWKTVLESDAKGYYAYLPAVFIYNDPNFGFFDEIEKNIYFDENLFYDYRAFVDSRYISKYYIGTAVVQMPLFLAAHLYAKMSGITADGYSKPYMIAISLSALLCLFTGLFFMNKTFRYFEVSSQIRALILFVAVFGTNLFYYTISEPGMSHIYSFALISSFFYVLVRYFEDLKASRLLILAFLFGLIILVRPVNGLILLALPIAAGNYERLKSGILVMFRNLRVLSGSVAIVLAILSIQLLFYKLSTGNCLVYSYIGEGFDFTDPHFFKILFSFKKGLFLYTPVYFLAFLGSIYLWKPERFRFFAWICFFIVITWVFSSWSNWWYGGSFSSRVYIEYLPVFMFVLALALIKAVNFKVRRALVVILLMLVVICQIQTYQYRYNHIHWSDMDKQKYFEVFLRVDRLI